MIGKKRGEIYKLASKRVEKIIKSNWKGLTEKLLCADCEHHLNVKFEDYYAKVFLSKEIPRSYNITKKVVRNSTGDFLLYQGLDYKNVKLYLLSIIWKLSVSKAFGSSVRLNKHLRERMRQMLLHCDEGAPDEFPFFIAQSYNKEKGDNEAIVPFGKLNGKRNIYYSIMGYNAIFVSIGPAVDAEISGMESFRLKETGELGILLLSDKMWKETLFEMSGIGKRMRIHAKHFPRVEAALKGKLSKVIL